LAQALFEAANLRLYSKYDANFPSTQGTAMVKKVRMQRLNVNHARWKKAGTGRLNKENVIIKRRCSEALRNPEL